MITDDHSTSVQKKMALQWSIPIFKLYVDVIIFRKLNARDVLHLHDGPRKVVPERIRRTKHSSFWCICVRCTTFLCVKAIARLYRTNVIRMCLSIVIKEFFYLHRTPNCVTKAFLKVGFQGLKNCIPVFLGMLVMLTLSKSFILSIATTQRSAINFMMSWGVRCSSGTPEEYNLGKPRFFLGACFGC